MFRAIILTVSMVFLAGTATAQTMQGQFKNWVLFTTKEDGKKVCYITANPTKKTGNYKKRGDVYIIVTHRGGASTPEVAYEAGFPFKKDIEADFIVDDATSLKFFTSDATPEMAWAKNESDDKLAVSAMKNGKKLTTTATSPKGTSAKDTFSLSGFGSAYNKMLSVCK